MARRYCRAHRIRFTTSFHTRFPEYLSQRFAIPTGWTSAVLRRFHNAGAGLMVATPSLGRELEAQGFERVLPWTRGVDTELFRPRPCGCSARRRCFSTSVASPPRRALQRSSTSTCPAARSWSAAARSSTELAAKYPDVAVHRQADRRGAGRVLRFGRRVRFPQPHRHLRHGAARSHGVGVAGRGASRVRAAGRGDATASPACCRTTCARRRWRPSRSIARGVRAKAAEYSWENAARLFLANITGACLNGPRTRAGRAQAAAGQDLAATTGARLSFMIFRLDARCRPWCRPAERRSSASSSCRGRCCGSRASRRAR